jgi:amino acid permease
VGLTTSPPGNLQSRKKKSFLSPLNVASLTTSLTFCSLFLSLSLFRPQMVNNEVRNRRFDFLGFVLGKATGIATLAAGMQTAEVCKQSAQKQNNFTCKCKKLHLTAKWYQSLVLAKGAHTRSIMLRNIACCAT